MKMPSTVDLARQLGGIEKTLEIFVDEFKRERAEAADHRRALRETIAAQSQATATVAAEMAEMKPLVQDYRTRRDQASGAAKLGKLMWAIMVSLGAIIGAVAAEVMRHIR